MCNSPWILLSLILAPVVTFLVMWIFVKDDPDN